MNAKLAWRNLWRNRRRTLITGASIMFAVFFAVLIQSMNRGSHEYMIDNMARFHTGFIQLQDSRFESEPSLDNVFEMDDALFERIAETHPNISFLVPRLETFMLAASEQQTRGAYVMGIEADLEHQLNGLKDHLKSGRFFTPGEGAVVMGEGLAGRLDVAVGDTLVLLGQGRFGTTAAGKFPIAGLVKHPMFEMNDQRVYMSLPDLQWVVSAEGMITTLLVTPERVRDTDGVAASVRESMTENGEFTVKTWPELMPELLQAIEFDMASAYVMSAILYIVIAFGLFGTILMMTLERVREFGVLLSIGMKRPSLSLVLFLESLLIGVIGVLAGCFISFLVVFYFYHHPIPLTGDLAAAIMDFGFEPILPFYLSGSLFLEQAVIVLLLSTLICLYPIIRVFRMDVLQASKA
jgi:putative ABC transport system permease protein